MQSDIELGYAGSYERFDTLSKKEASDLLGADNLVGDRFAVEFVSKNGTTTAWMKNKFDKLVAFFDPEVSRQLLIYHARGWKITALLSFVAYSDIPEPGEYWGEAAVICYDPRNHAEIFESFISSIGKKMEDSLRPDVSLGKDGIDRLIASKGTWMPSARIPLPNKETGMAILKRRRKISENLIEQGRAGNKGCYAISWAFIVVLVAAIVIGAYFLLDALGVL